MCTSISVVPCSFRRIEMGGYGGSVWVRMTGRSGSLAATALGAGGGGGGALGAVVTVGGGGAVAIWNSGWMATGGGGFTRSGGGGGGALGFSFGVSTVALISCNCFISAPWFSAAIRPKIT